MTISNLTKALPYFEDLGKKIRGRKGRKRKERSKKNSACICVYSCRKDVIVMNKKTDEKRKAKKEDNERKRQM